VSLFEADEQIGGQFNYAKRIPGKEEFFQTLRYYRRQIELLGVELHLATRVDPAFEGLETFDDLVVATGVKPRMPEIEGADHPSVLGYLDVLRYNRPVGKTAAIIGAGGIGFDVAEFLAGDTGSAEMAARLEQTQQEMVRLRDALQAVEKARDDAVDKLRQARQAPPMEEEVPDDENRLVDPAKIRELMERRRELLKRQSKEKG